MLQLYSSLFMSMYLSQFHPLETPFANKMELMNEATTILLTYCLMCFTQFLGDPTSRDMVGFYYLGINMLNVLTYLTFLILANCIICKRRALNSHTSRSNGKSGGPKSGNDSSFDSSDSSDESSSESDSSNSSGSQGEANPASNVLAVVQEADSQEELDLSI